MQVECPTGSGDYMHLGEVAEEIQHRIIHIFGRDVDGRRATNGKNDKLDSDPHFRDYIQFFEVCTAYLGISHFLIRTFSSSMLTMDEGLVPHIKPDGKLNQEFK